MLKLLKPILVVPLAAALLLVACEDAPAASAPDVVQADVPVDIAGTDAVAPGTDASADTLTGETDAVAASDVAQGCASPCIDSDDNPCTFVVCEQGSCVQKVLADGSVCEDGDPCTTADRCGGGSCKPSTEPASNVCACDSNADCAAFDDGLACNGQFFCDKGSFPYICKVNPATVPPCEGQTPPSTCLVAACAEPDQRRWQAAVFVEAHRQRDCLRRQEPADRGRYVPGGRLCGRPVHRQLPKQQRLHKF